MDGLAFDDGEPDLDLSARWIQGLHDDGQIGPSRDLSHSAPLSELTMGEHDTRLNLAEILAGWKADDPDIVVETFLLVGPPRGTVASVSADAQLLVVGCPVRGRQWTRWIGSVARAVLERATCPIAVVPQQHPRSLAAD